MDTKKLFLDSETRNRENVDISSQFPTLRKDQRVFSNSLSAAPIFPWQKSTKVPMFRVACSWSERFKKSVSVTTWLMWTTCGPGCWGCWGLGFGFSKETSFPPNYKKEKYQKNMFQTIGWKRFCAKFHQDLDLDLLQKRLLLVCGSI